MARPAAEREDQYVVQREPMNGFPITIVWIFGLILQHILLEPINFIFNIPL